MPRQFEKTIIFRVDEHLDRTIALFAQEKGYKYKSDLIRDILTLHFMSLMLGYLPSQSFEDMQKEFLQKFNTKKKMAKAKMRL
jgi:conjugal transfer/entry exclusion protein